MLPEAYRRPDRRSSTWRPWPATAFSSELPRSQQQIGILATDDDHPRDFSRLGNQRENRARIRKSAHRRAVGTTLMKVYGWKVGDTIMLRGTVYPVDLQLTIVGVLNAQAAGPRIIFRRDYMEELLGRPGVANLFWVKIDRSQSAPEVIAAIDEMFANSAHETATETEVALIKSEMAGVLPCSTERRKISCGDRDLHDGSCRPQHGRDGGARTAPRDGGDGARSDSRAARSLRESWSRD